METYNKKKLGNFVFLPIAAGILGFGSPVFFATVSERALEDAGEGSKTMEEEEFWQLRQNNLGPAEMLLPLTKVELPERIRRGGGKEKTGSPRAFDF